MKKYFLTLALLCVPALCRAGLFSSAGANDYSNQAAVTYVCATTGTLTTQAGVSVTSPTISLYNPTGSGKNLVLLDVGVDIMAAPAAAAGLSLAFNVAPSTGTRAGVNGPVPTITSAIIGTSTSTLTTAAAKCFDYGFLHETPTLFRFLGGTTGASAIGGAQFNDAVSGKIVIPPGGTISLQSSSAAQVQAHFTWREDNL